MTTSCSVSTPSDSPPSRGVIEHEAIDAFLHGAKNGMFQMEWNLVCPTCGDSVDSFRSLNKLNSHFYCTVCDLNSEATLDDYIQVTFTISPEIREISYHRPEALVHRGLSPEVPFQPERAPSPADRDSSTRCRPS